jgi:isoquinoline 1-oxidoreductase alpha subunit
VIKLTINGAPWQYDGDPQMPLLWFIRDIANLTGTKYGCGIAVCGACTVHLDGSAQRACVLTMAAVDGKSVITIEGLSEKADHPLQQAWREAHVPQCGFCQAGQIMQAADLLSTNNNPSDADIDSAMQGNICRCGTYPRIRKAIKQAAVQYAGGSNS